MTPIILLKYRHEFRVINSKDWILALFSGLFLAAHFILWFESLNYTSGASSVVLVTLQPIFAFIGTYLFFNECFSSCSFIIIFITSCGNSLFRCGGI